MIEYSSVTQSLQPPDISISAAVAASVEAVKRTGGLPAVAAEIRSHKAKHKPLTQKSFADVVAELLVLEKSHRASGRYLENLKFRLEKFASALVGVSSSPGMIRMQSFGRFSFAFRKTIGDVRFPVEAKTIRVFLLVCRAGRI